MKYFVSSLINDFDNMEEIAQWINDHEDKDLGVELIAFTHDKEYWQRLENILKTLDCPISFHGPYIKTEGTARPSTPEYDFLFESYRRVFELAKNYNVEHVVYHYSQKQFNEENIIENQKQSKENISELLKLASSYGVKLLIENIAFQEGTRHLYDNEEFFDLFKEFDNAYAIIDTGHANINKLDLELFLSTYGDRVLAYHFHNNDGFVDSHCRVRDGSFNFEDFMKKYNKYTPHANIVLEYEPSSHCDYDCIEEDLKYIKKLQD